MGVGEEKWGWGGSSGTVLALKPALDLACDLEFQWPAEDSEGPCGGSSSQTVRSAVALMVKNFPLTGDYSKPSLLRRRGGAGKQEQWAEGVTEAKVKDDGRGWGCMARWSKERK